MPVCFFGSFKEETAHLWETMVQVMVWLSHLAEESLIDLDSIEILAEFRRTLLERVGNRPGMSGFALTWLAGSRMSLMRLNGIPLIEMILAPDSLYVRSTRCVHLVPILVLRNASSIFPINQGSTVLAGQQKFDEELERNFVSGF